MDPAEERAKELLREPLGAVQVLEHVAAEDLLDESRIEARDLEERSILFKLKCAVGEEYMHVGVEVGGVRAERLDRDDQSRRDIVAIEDRAAARGRSRHEPRGRAGRASAARAGTARAGHVES